MALKDILLLLDTAEGPSQSADTAIDLANRFGAHVTALALSVDPIVPGLVVAPIPIELIEASREAAMKIATDAVARFEELARRSDISRETRIAEVLMGGIPQTFSIATRLTDLVVIGQDHPDHREPLREVLIETALFEGIAPILFVPYIAREPLKTNKVMVAWDGSRPAARAIHAAVALLPAGTSISIVMIGSAADQVGEPGADLATWLARHRFRVSIETLPSAGLTVAQTMLNHVADRGFDLVVMGGYGHSWIREALIGGATRDILAAMTVPVLMAH